jgi:hypothetical protein
MAAPTDPMPTSGLYINAKVSTPFLAQVKQMATYSREGYSDKAPGIVSAVDTNTQISGYVRPGYGLLVSGTQMAWTQTDTNQGIFLESAAGNKIRQTNITLATPSQAAIIPSLDPAAQPAGAASVEHVLSLVTKYTENGSLRTGVLGTPLRTTNVITDTNKKVFVIGADTVSGVTISAYTGADADFRMQASIDPSTNLLKVKLGTLAGVFGDVVTVSEATDYTLTGLASDVTLTVDDYDKFYDNVLARGRYMEEVGTIEALTP